MDKEVIPLIDEYFFKTMGDLLRLTTNGKGETQPIDKNETATGKANNRRVEFVKM